MVLQFGGEQTAFYGRCIGRWRDVDGDLPGGEDKLGDEKNR